MNIDARRRPHRLAVPLIVTLALAGCGGSSAASHPPTHTAAPRTTRAAAHDPVLTASNRIPVPTRVRRIVSLSPAATEDLYAVGAGSQVVAVDQYSTYPASAPRTKLSGFSPNAEAIAGYRPDLVVVSMDSGHIASQLAALHIPVLMEPAPAGLSGAYRQIMDLGRATGHAPQATQEVTRLRARIAAIAASVPHPATPLTYYHELDQTHYTASSQTFIGRLYALLGLRNIADSAAATTPYPQLSSEYIIARDPGLIVLADAQCCGQSARTVAARPGWSGIAAVRHHAVLPVDATIASEWGPRIVDFLGTIAAEVRRVERR